MTRDSADVLNEAPPNASEVLIDTLTELIENTPKSLTDLANAEDVLRRITGPRVVFELLQNAHDASAKGSSRPRTHLKVTPEALLLANEGVPFTRAGYEAITGIAKSPKRVSRARRVDLSEGKLRFGQVGHKGIGFRSVLHLSKQPQIFCSLPNGERFGIQFGLPRVRSICACILDADEFGLRSLMTGAEAPVVDAILARRPLSQSPLVLNCGRRGVSKAALLDNLPILSLPLWLDEWPADAVRLLGLSEGAAPARPFTTLIRLPIPPDQVSAVRDKVQRDMARLKAGKKTP